MSGFNFAGGNKYGGGEDYEMENSPRGFGGGGAAAAGGGGGLMGDNSKNQIPPFKKKTKKSDAEKRRQREEKERERERERQRENEIRAFRNFSSTLPDTIMDRSRVSRGSMNHNDFGDFSGTPRGAVGGQLEALHHAPQPNIQKDNFSFGTATQKIGLLPPSKLRL